MLINFSFKNYKSFKDTQQFSMQLRKGKETQSWKSPDVSTITALYGANGSGKSNFLNALNFVSDFVWRSYRYADRHDEIDCSPFVLDKDARVAPSEFLIECIAADGVRYVYSFGVNKTSVEYEELVAYYSNQPSKLFTRESGADGQTIKFGASFTGQKKQLWAITRPNALFLSAAYAGGSAVIAPVYEDLVRGVWYYDAAYFMRELDYIKLAARDDAAYLERLAELIEYADVGIDGMKVMRSGFSDDEDTARSEPDRAEGMRNREWLASTDVYFYHKGAERAWFSSDMESDGTLAALAFFSVALRALDAGAVVLVDEIDRSLHPVLCREFISLFADEATNPHQAQLIFTTHDVALIISSGEYDRVIDREQIWFAEKDEKGVSELIPLTDYSPRAGENFGRNYLNGVYHAVPRLAFHQLVADLMGRDA